MKWANRKAARDEEGGTVKLTRGVVNDCDRPSSVIMKMWRLVLVTNWTRTVTYKRKGPNSYSFLMSLSDGPCDFTNGKD